MAGAIGGTLFQLLVGEVVDKSGGSFVIPFAISASAYLVALGVIHLLAPKLEPASV
jgi:ACS family hexuronate transporter-like MFS transporter